MIICNSVLVSVIIVLILCLYKTNVVIALTAGALFCGLIDGFSLHETVQVFSNGLGAGARIALSYAILGAFASAVAHSGLPDLLAKELILLLKIKSGTKFSLFLAKVVFFIVIGLMSIACKNIIPVHIAFIPILIPPLLGVFNAMNVDRRIFSCIMTCGLIVSYMIIPVGFGEIFLDNILRNYLISNGLNISLKDIIYVLKFPAIAMIFGVLVAMFTYRKKRIYKVSVNQNIPTIDIAKSYKTVIVSVLAILVALIVQIVMKEIILGALAGFFIFSCFGIVCRNESDRVVVDGFKMMAGISFTMLAAAGFGNILHATNDIVILVNWFAQHVGDNKLLVVVGMLSVGFLISVGIGSSFSTVPIVAAVYVPLCIKLEFSPMAIAVIVAISGICGDASSPASDSTLGPTMGLNTDNQHDHIYDTVLPTFLHITIPAFLCAVICTLVL